MLMITRLPSLLLIGLVKGYRYFISPFLPPSCRFYPSCSTYAVEALRRHGALRGLGLTTWRLLRCHPLHPGGVDLVPEPRGTAATSSSRSSSANQPAA